MSPQEQSARLAGQTAAIRNIVATANPHPLGTTTSRAWSKGWREIDEQRRRGVS